MIKALFIIAAVVFLGGFGVWFYENPGAVQIVWLGYEVTAGMGIFSLFIVVLGFASALVFWLLGRIFSLPSGVMRYFRNRKKARALEELQACLMDLTAGKVEATRHAKRLEESLGKDDVLLGHLLQGMVSLSVGNLSEAESRYRKLSEKNKTAFVGFNGLAQVAERQGNTGLAIENALKARKFDSHSPNNERMLAHLYESDGDYDKAIDILESAASHKLWERQDIDRQTAELYGKLAERARAAGNLKAAMSHGEKAHKQDPHNKELAARLAKIYGSTDNMRQAEKIIARLLDGDRGHALQTYGEVLAAAFPAGSKDAELKRLSHAEEMLNAHTADVTVSHFLAELCLQAQVWGKARGLLEAVTADNHNALHCRLMARLEQGEFGGGGNGAEAARLWLQKAAAFENA